MIATCTRVLLVVGTAFALLFGLSNPASAHPLGNTTVNHYDGLEIHPDRILNSAVVDTAEIPTFQRKRRIDADRNGQLSAAEQQAYAAQQCQQMSRVTELAVNGRRVGWQLLRSRYSERPGQVGLTAGRLECDLQAQVQILRPAQVSIDSGFDSQGLGWHEITARGVGVSLQDSPFPATSISDALRAYPDNLLSEPLDVRSGSVSVQPGSRSSTYQAVEALPLAGPAVRALDNLSQRFNETVGAENLTVGVGILAVLLSMLLGAGHAFLPGHGKTVMAAYLVGRRGQLRDVITVGATVTFTHTAGVMVIGLLLASGSALAPTTAQQVLGVVSGAIIALVGIGLLVSAVRRRSTPRLQAALAPEPVREVALVGAGHDHPHDHDHPHEHEHETHRHGLFGRGHSHAPAPATDGRFSRSGLIGLGIAGGLVPSPSALLVLVAATALGRTAFGLLLVVGYGIGMALALCAAGLLLVRMRGRLDRFAGSTRLARADRLLAVLPALTALLVIAVGLGLAARAVGGSV